MVNSKLHIDPVATALGSDAPAPLQGAEIFPTCPGVARFALTPGYFISRLQREDRLRPRNFILRLRHSHQPTIEPADDVLEPLDAVPGLA